MKIHFISFFLLSFAILNIGTVARAQSYNGMALAWNRDGAWVVRERSNKSQAISAAVRDCRRKYGSCRLGITVGNGSYSCIAIARHSGRLYASSRNSSRRAANAAISNCGSRNCSLEYVGCND